MKEVYSEKNQMIIDECRNTIISIVSNVKSVPMYVILLNRIESLLNGKYPVEIPPLVREEMRKAIINQQIEALNSYIQEVGNSVGEANRLIELLKNSIANGEESN